MTSGRWVLWVRWWALFVLLVLAAHCTTEVGSGVTSDAMASSDAVGLDAVDAPTVDATPQDTSAEAADGPPALDAPAVEDVASTDAPVVVDVPAEAEVSVAVDVRVTDSSADDAPADAPVDATPADVPPDTASDTAPADVLLDAAADADGGVDAPDAVVDGGGFDPCATTLVVDLNRAGTFTANLLRYTGNTRAAPLGATLTNVCMNNTTAQVVLRYVPRTTNRLRVSTNNTGTTSNFDTVVWAQSACARGASSLGCNDDAATSPRPNASTFITPVAVTAGEPVYVVVAGAGAPTGGRVSQGAFELTVAEYNVVPAGMPCDPTGAVNTCATGSVCVTIGTSSTCAADGARGGRCRTGTGVTPCDTGLVCTSANRCAATVAVGASCDAARISSICPTGSTCLTFGSSSRCVADGAADGRCRSTTPGCDMGLGCNREARCVPRVEAGVPCDPLGVENLCASGLGCTGSPPTCQLLRYAESVIAAPVFVDACALGRHLALISDTEPRDDGHASSSVGLGFRFLFFDTFESQFWPSTNGYGVFGTTAPTDAFEPPLPIVGDFRVIAPFYADLIFGAGPASDVCALTTGAAPMRQFLVEWRNASVLGYDMTLLTFELVLSETTNTIDFIYARLDPATGTMAPFADGTQASIGITYDGETIVHEGPVRTTSGVRFTPR